MTSQQRDARGRFGTAPHPEGEDLSIGIGSDVATPGEQSPDPALVNARNVLLTGLSALGAHLEALTIIGAQAVFEQTKASAWIPMTRTTDADTCLAPSLISSNLDIGSAMAAAGFVQQSDRPGVWRYSPSDGTEPIGFDILVPGAVAGPGRRGARIPGQDRHAVGRADGLELTPLDRKRVAITALDGSDFHLDAYVAGPAAITCAKAYKLAERINARDVGRRDRVLPKDAGDIWRIMAVSDPTLVRSVYEHGEKNAVIARAVLQGRAYLTTLFSESMEGVDLAVQDVGAVIPEDSVREIVNEWMAKFNQHD